MRDATTDTSSAGRMSLRSQNAYTLIELLIVMSVATVVFGAILTILEVSQRVVAHDTERALSTQETRTGLARMAREIRQASASELKEATANTLLFTVTIGGKEAEISYSCSEKNPQYPEYNECVRREYEAGKLLSSSVSIPVLVKGGSAFSYSSSTTPTASDVVTMKLEVPIGGTLEQAGRSGYQHNIVLEDAAFIRNRDPEG